MRLQWTTAFPAKTTQDDVDEDEFQKSLQLFIRNPQKRKAKANKKQERRKQQATMVWGVKSE